MNVEKLQQVEQWLLAGAPERTFNMNVFLDDLRDKENWCGTSCCIAGYVFQQTKAYDAVIKKGERFWQWDHEVEVVAATALEMDREQAHKLFYVKDSEGMHYEGDWEDITPKQAAQAVRNVIETGTPQWETILDFEEKDEDY